MPTLKNTEYFDEAEIKFNPRLKQVIFSFLLFQHEADSFDLTFAPHLISLVFTFKTMQWVYKFVFFFTSYELFFISL